MYYIQFCKTVFHNNMPHLFFCCCFLLHVQNQNKFSASKNESRNCAWCIFYCTSTEQFFSLSMRKKTLEAKPTTNCGCNLFFGEDRRWTSCVDRQLVRGALIVNTLDLDLCFFCQEKEGNLKKKHWDPNPGPLHMFTVYWVLTMNKKGVVKPKQTQKGARFITPSTTIL